MSDHERDEARRRERERMRIDHILGKWRENAPTVVFTGEAVEALLEGAAERGGFAGSLVGSLLSGIGTSMAYRAGLELAKGEAERQKEAKALEALEATKKKNAAAAAAKKKEAARKKHKAKRKGARRG